ncbi:response regulator [Thalassospira lucentensis]|uniref:response regulator n=1 Tax=Thalassospira lucentensis TaxID=168935 RepID=UPI003D2F4361
MSAFDYLTMKIVVIEDDIYIRQIIVRLLRQIGFRSIYEASDGKAGMEQVIRTRPDIILCDIHMEPMDGLEFLRTLRNFNHPRFSAIPVIFLTSDVQGETVIAARDLDVSGYIAKPVSVQQLKEKLDAVLQH